MSSTDKRWWFNAVDRSHSVLDRSDGLLEV